MPRTVPALFLLLLLVPLRARADTPEQERDAGPHLVTDALYVGARGEPNVALLLGWDLDLYLTGTRAVSMGPALSIAVAGDEPDADGRRQDFLATLDFLRWKFQINRVGSSVRWHVLVGAGMYWASLPAQQGPVRELVLSDGSVTTGYADFPHVEGFGGQATFGIGVDLFEGSSFGASLFTLAHVRLDDDMHRMPRIWAETAIGIRFGA